MDEGIVTVKAIHHSHLDRSLVNGTLPFKSMSVQTEAGRQAWVSDCKQTSEMAVPVRCGCKVAG
jgi:hypothetical protein